MGSTSRGNRRRERGVDLGVARADHGSPRRGLCASIGGAAREPGAALGAGAESWGRERPRRRRPRGAPGSLPPICPVRAATGRSTGSGPCVNGRSRGREPTSQSLANVTCRNLLAATTAIRDHFVLSMPAEPAGPVDPPPPAASVGEVHKVLGKRPGEAPAFPTGSAGVLVSTAGTVRPPDDVTRHDDDETIATIARDSGDRLVPTSDGRQTGGSPCPG